MIAKSVATFFLEPEGLASASPSAFEYPARPLLQLERQIKKPAFAGIG
jgi:hypothetical protein